MWKSTAELGVGIARGAKHGLIVVARYSPMGSTGGISSFLNNVNAPSEFLIFVLGVTGIKKNLQSC